MEQGSAAVLNYFREIDEQGVDRLFEAKVLLVGEGGSGKTSLLRRLYQPGLPLPSEDETTRGIDISRHEFETGDGRAFRLNVWDFGGQQIYHATHQFFLTKSSLYVLVDDTRKDHKTIHDEGFKYWLDAIEALSDRSPVLLFQNEKGGRSKSIDKPGISARFDNVAGFHAGDLNDPASADDMRRAIQFHVQRLPHVGEEVPSKWVSIREAVEARGREEPYISQQDYFDLYREHLPFDQEKARHLSRYLHDLGVFLHFQDDRRLDELVILQNSWATNAAFAILDDEPTKARFGRFTYADCRRVWDRPEYAGKHVELLALMEKFELCYPLADIEPETWLAPQLLPPSIPAALDPDPQPGDLLLAYRYDFLPKGLISRLMVRMNRFVRRPDLSWEAGVLFEQGDTSVLARATGRGDEIALRARGPESAALRNVIASDLDALNASFRGLRGKVDKLVPCICSLCAASGTPGFFPLQKLQKRRRDRQLQVECPADSYEMMNVLELLDGLKLEELSPWPDDRGRAPDVFDTTPPPARTVTIFLASSEELREDRDAIELYLRQQNDRFRQQGLYVEVVRWENFLDAMSETRKQDDYNRHVRETDVFLSLFETKTGSFTEEEFDVAHRAFLEHGRPLIYTFFRDSQVSISQMDPEAFQSLWAFQAKLRDLGHFWTGYDDVEGLKLQVKDQLEKLITAGRL